VRWLDLDEVTRAHLVAHDVLDRVLAAASAPRHDVELGAVDQRDQSDGAEAFVLAG
jgi:hypothetical protein